MEIKVWKGFKKRRNSTKQPSSTDAVTLQVRLKEPTSVENPTFIISGNDFTINYIEAFGHYYFVENINSIRNGLCEYDCTMDLLASYKSDIGNLNTLIERSDTAFNKWITDPLIPVLPTSKVTLDMFSNFNFSTTGCYIVQVVSDETNNGAVTTFACNQSNMAALVAWLNSQDGSFVNWALLQFSSLMEWIVNCFWLPIGVDQIPGSNATIKWAGQSTGCSGKLISGGILTFSSSVTPTLPSDFRRNLARISVFLPHYGLVDIPISKVRNGSSVTLTANVDLHNGECMYKLTDTADNKTEYIMTVTTSIASQVPIAQQNAGIAQGLAGNAAGAIGSALSFNIPGAISSVENMITENLLNPGVNVKGSFGGRSMRMENDPYMFIQVSDTGDITEPVGTFGRPLRENRTISNLSGFVKCIDASISCDATGAEKDAINGLLNSGFFYE